VRLGNLVHRFDRLQRSRSVFGFPLAVRLKYTEDHGSYLAAIVTYYAFLSQFPLLLVAATVLGFVLRGHPRFNAASAIPFLAHSRSSGMTSAFTRSPATASRWASD